jgi:hypothetical protein
MCAQIVAGSQWQLGCPCADLTAMLLRASVLPQVSMRIRQQLQYPDHAARPQGIAEEELDWIACVVGSIQCFMLQRHAEDMAAQANMPTR